MGIDRGSGVGGERVGTDRRNDVGRGESGDRYGRRVGIDRTSGVGGGEGDRQEKWDEMGREWG